MPHTNPPDLSRITEAREDIVNELANTFYYDRHGQVSIDECRAQAEAWVDAYKQALIAYLRPEEKKRSVEIRGSGFVSRDLQSDNQAARDYDQKVEGLK